jgi:uncharacterized membrane protein YfcA
VTFLLLFFALAVLSGATASVVGFGIGSLLTPILATKFDASIAVAAVTLPHALATAVRCWRLRRNIDRDVLMRFGLLSAVGALAGAVVHARLGQSILTAILGGLMVLTAIAQLTAWAARWRPTGPLVGVLGLLSGFFGGVAGNQGGLRAAALTAFGLSPAAFVATATAAGLMVDVARTPIYLVTTGSRLIPLAPYIGVAAIGVLLGTLLGERLLLGMSPRRFGNVIGVAIGLLGVWLIASTVG